MPCSEFQVNQPPPHCSGPASSSGGRGPKQCTPSSLRLGAKCNVSWALRQKGKHRPSAFLFETNSERRPTAPRKLKPTVCSESRQRSPPRRGYRTSGKSHSSGSAKTRLPSAVTQTQGLVWDVWKGHQPRGGRGRRKGRLRIQAKFTHNTPESEGQARQ